MNTPKLRFKDETGTKFPDWNKRRLEEILTIYNGKDYKDLKSGEFPVFGTGGVITFVDKYLCNWNCVCIGRKGTINKPIFMDEPFWCVDTLFYTKPKEKNNPKFQFYLFETIDWQKYNTATGVPSLTGTTIGNIIVEIPTIFEQNKIADFLSSYDEKLRLQRNRIEALERRKKGLLQKVFSQEIRFKADDGKEFPKWDEIPFCKAFYSISNNTLSRSELSFDVKTSVRNIHYGDVLIKYGAVIHTNIDTIPYVIEIEDKLTKEKLLKSGDVIFADTAEDNTVGKACELILGDDSDSIVAGLHTIAVRPNEAFAFGYLGYFFNSTLFHDQLLPLIQGIKVSSISKRALFSETKVFYPSLPEQRKIADFFTAIDDQINIEKERLTTMETIKKGLLQGLFC